METLWFCLVSFTVVMYVVLDGFDLGAGVVALLAARTDAERQRIRRAIGPVWDGNEVWLVVAGATLYFAFPAVYARSFSGFYLPLIIVLWLLILRGIAIELAHHIHNPLWHAFWDRLFGLASLALTVVFGAALGNVVRGVPLDAEGRFFEPLWTDFRTTGQTGILDWYTLLVGATALVALTLHGALYLVLKTDGDLQGRARRWALRLWAPLAVLMALLTYATFQVQPHVAARLVAHPWGFVFPGLTVAGWLAMRRFTRTGAEARAFLMSCLFLAGALGSAVFGIYPYLLPANTDPALGLTVHGSATSAYGLRVGLAWWIPGMVLAALYFTYVYRRFAGKVPAEADGY
ncbi:MAG: cytochrome d ubiquinol oxidase subunit II [Planctomycetota bacterium]|jgi:cytochrome d ubiquinol oxidase subunit II